MQKLTFPTLTFPRHKTSAERSPWSFSELKKFHNLNAQNLLEFIPLSSKLLNNFPEQICGIKESKIA
jgi:hypothetical protein